MHTARGGITDSLFDLAFVIDQACNLSPGVVGIGRELLYLTVLALLSLWDGRRRHRIKDAANCVENSVSLSVSRLPFLFLSPSLPLISLGQEKTAHRRPQLQNYDSFLRFLLSPPFARSLALCGIWKKLCGWGQNNRCEGTHSQCEPLCPPSLPRSPSDNCSVLRCTAWLPSPSLSLSPGLLGSPFSVGCCGYGGRRARKRSLEHSRAKTAAASTIHSSECKKERTSCPSFVCGQNNRISPLHCRVPTYCRRRRWSE